MNVKAIFITLILLALGISFFGRGITGLSIAKTCCLGEDCEEIYKCDQIEISEINHSRIFYILGSVCLIGMCTYLMFKNDEIIWG